MNDDMLDELTARISPVRDEEIFELDLRRAEASLRSEILATPRGDTTTHTTRYRRPATVLAAAVIVIAAATWATQLGDNSERAWASEAIAVAEGAPRLLVTDGTWQVATADEFSRDRGSMTFTDGGQVLQLDWRSGIDHDHLVQDRASASEDLGDLEVLGATARVFRSGAAHHRAVWILGAHSVEAHGEFESMEQFTAVLRALRMVDVDTWLNALPDTVVRADGRALAVDQLLSDVPLPVGFDVDTLRQDGIVQDRYQLGAAVTTAVACRWLETWLDAGDSGDAVARARAEDALTSSRDWQVLREMRPHGDLPEVIWEFAEAVESGGPMPGGRPLTIRESYQSLCSVTTP